MKCFPIFVILMLMASSVYASDSLWSKAKNLLPGSSDVANPDEFLDIRDEQFKDTWNDVLEKLQEGLSVSDKIQDAPEASFFSEDKSSLRKDLNAILEDVMQLLIDKSFSKYRYHIEHERKNITELHKNIISYQESMVTAPKKSMIHTTKDGYKDKIMDAKTEIKQSEAKIERIKDKMAQSFDKIGVSLSSDQIDVLMARIDGNNIIQMTLIMDSLKHITNQLMSVMKDSNEELRSAKRYYGMHMILLELMIYIQDEYIKKVDNIYLPKIASIVGKTVKIRSQAKSSVRNSKEESRITVYKNNIEAHNLTLKVAELYLKNLNSQKLKVSRARAVAKKDLRLARNTYDTVSVSADLYAVLSSSKKLFSKVMSLQVPVIIPFENLQMKNKYEELTSIIQKSGGQ